FPTPRLVASLIALGCVLLGGRPASAEWIADLFVGPTFTRSQDVKVDSTAGRGVFRDVDFDTAISGGVRVGRYFDAVPFLGVAVDGFLFYPNIGTQSTRLRSEERRVGKE